MANAKVTRRRRKGFWKTIPENMRPGIAAGVRKAAGLVVATQRSLAPVDDGDLRDSITFGMGDQQVPYAVFRASGGGDPDLSAMITAGNTKVRYAHLVEFGTAPHPQGGAFAGTKHPGTPPRPFFLSGYRLARKGAKATIRKAVRDAVKQAASKG